MRWRTRWGRRGHWKGQLLEFHLDFVLELRVDVRGVVVHLWLILWGDWLRNGFLELLTRWNV